MNTETPIWSGTSSQLKNLGVYLVCALLCWLVVPVFIAVWKWLEVKTKRFELTTERLLTTCGVLSKETETLELYRVRDIRVTQPFLLRMFGLENIELLTTDQSTPAVVLDYMPQQIKLGDKFRAQVELCRVQKRVREIDIE